MGTTTAQPPHLDSLQGRGDFGWADVMQNTRQSGRSGRRQLPRCRAMLMGSFAPTI